MTKWTHFWDMNSGGETKETPYDHIFIEAPEHLAKRIFYAKFGHNPERVSCTCCGADYSISESNSLEQATAYQRHCRFDKLADRWVEEQDPSDSRPRIPLLIYVEQPNVKIIRSGEWSPSDIERDPPEQGYVWQD